MGFYFDDRGKTRYISNIYLKNDLLKNGKNPVPSNEEDNSEITLAKKLGVEIPKYQMNELMAKLTTLLRNSNSQELLLASSIGRGELLAILYLLTEGIIIDSDIKNILEPQTYSTRSEILLSYLDVIDNISINAFSKLKSEIRKMGNYKNSFEPAAEKVQRGQEKYHSYLNPSYLDISVGDLFYRKSAYAISKLNINQLNGSYEYDKLTEDLPKTEFITKLFETDDPKSLISNLDADFFLCIEIFFKDKSKQWIWALIAPLIIFMLPIVGFNVTLAAVLAILIVVLSGGAYASLDPAMAYVAFLKIAKSTNVFSLYGQKLFSLRFDMFITDILADILYKNSAKRFQLRMDSRIPDESIDSIKSETHNLIPSKFAGVFAFYAAIKAGKTENEKNLNSLFRPIEESDWYSSVMASIYDAPELEKYFPITKLDDDDLKKFNFNPSKIQFDAGVDDPETDYPDLNSEDRALLWKILAPFTNNEDNSAIIDTEKGADYNIKPRLNNDYLIAQITGNKDGIYGLGDHVLDASSFENIRHFDILISEKNEKIPFVQYSDDDEPIVTEKDFHIIYNFGKSSSVQKCIKDIMTKAEEKCTLNTLESIQDNLNQLLVIVDELKAIEHAKPKDYLDFIFAKLIVKRYVYYLIDDSIPVESSSFIFTVPDWLYRVYKFIFITRQTIFSFPETLQTVKTQLENENILKDPMASTKNLTKLYEYLSTLKDNEYVNIYGGLPEILLALKGLLNVPTDISQLTTSIGIKTPIGINNLNMAILGLGGL